MGNQRLTVPIANANPLYRLCWVALLTFVSPIALIYDSLSAFCYTLILPILRGLLSQRSKPAIGVDPTWAKGRYEVTTTDAESNDMKPGESIAQSADSARKDSDVAVGSISPSILKCS